MIDNKELDEIMSILENLEDEKLSVKLLSSFNEKSKNLGTLLMNKDENLSHDDWKIKCDNARKELDLVLNEIYSLKEGN